MKTNIRKMFYRSTSVPVAILLIGFCVLSTLVGCNETVEPKLEMPENIVVKPDPLVMLVVGDEGVGDRIARQWRALEDGELELVGMSVEDFIANDFDAPEDLAVDVLVYPPEMIAELVNRARIRKVPTDLIQSSDFNKIGLLKHFRVSVIRHEGETWAVPLGAPNFSLLVNSKVVSEKSIPNNWSRMGRALSQISSYDEGNPDGFQYLAKVDMPLAESWAAWTFLARAAPSVCNRGKLSTVFDRENIQPLINLPPFVEALEQLKSIASERSYELDPAGVFRLMQGGKSAIAMSWPSIAFDPSLNQLVEEEGSEKLTTEQTIADFSVHPLPGALRWYDQKSERWIIRKKSDEKRVGLIGFSGLVASVAKESLNEQTAWGFLKWLPDKAISKVTMAECAISGPFRASHLGEMVRWTGDWVPESAAFEYADVIEQNHQRGVVLMFPRIPQASRYLEVLDIAVRRVIAGEAEAQAALDAVARRWDEMTDEIGRESQRKRLRKVTGI
ncbi:hypothetical protein OAU26_04335 [Mariniblastus sp.]|nr:hypothetical protein [Mariniblastus sp.]MDA7928443.1 hypothetical protein [Mariniblastus sp.]MDC3224142.1 hypothetical protein [Mariniblastus sp.]